MSKVVVILTMCLFVACAAPEAPTVQSETDTTVANDTAAVADTLIVDTTDVDTAK